MKKTIFIEIWWDSSKKIRRHELYQSWNEALAGQTSETIALHKIEIELNDKNQIWPWPL